MPRDKSHHTLKVVDPVDVIPSRPPKPGVLKRIAAGVFTLGVLAVALGVLTLIARVATLYVQMLWGLL